MPRKLLVMTVSAAAFFVFIQFASASTTAVLLPQSDGNYKQLKPSTGSTHYTMVNESVCNGLTNYNSTGSITVVARDSYGISVTSIGMGDGALISQIDIVPCASLNSGSGSASSNEFYRWNGVDSSDFGTHSVSGTTPMQLATSTISGLSLFKTSTSTLEIGAEMSTTSSKGFRLSRIAPVLTYSLTVPSAPSALKVTNISNTENDLTWTDNSNNELGFRIYRSSNGAAYTRVATTTTWNITSYNDTSVTSGNTYSYKVAAYNSAGEATSSVVYSTITISSNIASTTSWQPYYVYVVNGAIHVNSGVTLTIQPGTVVKFYDTSSGLQVDGILNAQGATTSTIYFTSYKDDSVGGDSNADGSSSGAASDWDVIKTNSGASTTISYAIVHYGGHGNTTAANIYNSGGTLAFMNATSTQSGHYYGIYVDSGTTTITSAEIYSETYGLLVNSGITTVSSTKFHDNTQNGIYLQGTGNLTLTNSTFSNNTFGAVFDYLHYGPTFTHSGNTFTTGSTGENGIVMQDSLAANMTWTNDGLPYVIANSSGVTVPYGKNLAIN
jgi:parallel beta-helix repeat protein